MSGQMGRHQETYSSCIHDEVHVADSHAVNRGDSDQSRASDRFRLIRAQYNAAKVDRRGAVEWQVHRRPKTIKDTVGIRSVDLAVSKSWALELVDPSNLRQADPLQRSIRLWYGIPRSEAGVRVSSPHYGGTFLTFVLYY